MKLTFKKLKYEGFSNREETTIKIDGKEIGSIFEKNNEVFKIMPMVEKEDINCDNNPNCKWMNITFKKEFTTEDSARKWLSEKIESISKKYTFNKEW